MSELPPVSFNEASPSPNAVPDGRLSVESNRRLLSPEVMHQGVVTEYVDARTSQRLIVLRDDDASVGLHHKLTRRGVPVFPLVGMLPGQVLLEVPADARTVLGSLPFISRDVVGYGPTFRQLGDLMARVQAAGFGLPAWGEERGLLVGMAVASDDNSRYGSGLTLIPPYEFDELGTKRALLEDLGDEIMTSGYFDAPKKDFLLRQVHEGWDEFRH